MHRHLVSVAALGLVVAVPVSCRPQPSIPAIAVPEETLAQAREARLDYLASLSRASAGDRDSIVQLIRFCESADGSGALGHGVGLIELVTLAGDTAFADAARPLAASTLRALARSLEAGTAYLSDARLQAPLAEQAPRTAALLAGVDR